MTLGVEESKLSTLSYPFKSLPPVPSRSEEVWRCLESLTDSLEVTAVREGTNILQPTDTCQATNTSTL